jgi:hypothetical protein
MRVFGAARTVAVYIPQRFKDWSSHIRCRVRATVFSADLDTGSLDIIVEHPAYISGVPEGWRTVVMTIKPSIQTMEELALSGTSFIEYADAQPWCVVHMRAAPRARCARARRPFAPHGCDFVY